MVLRLVTKRAGWLLLALGLIAPLGGCAAAPTAPSGPAAATFTAPLLDARVLLPIARQRWRSARIARYDLDVSLGCFCWMVHPTRLTFQVRDGVSVAPDLDATIRERVRFYESVDALFQLLEDAARRDPYRFEVTFDPDYGYPRTGFIDREWLMADDELGFSVDLRPVP